MIFEQVWRLGFGVYADGKITVSTVDIVVA
jgi:hypothetical protein